ncbi:uncharacterized protein LOC129238070 [Anastrepha obliqua]|uniref:uncharacterized protein LOC129238070 n=1 Tax=Anastrepha obliqua TaxID=95512 RepID=UPI002409F3E4|nr:uncharacterized protein LOC129238070 [Anastrepha obliqua]
MPHATLSNNRRQLGCLQLNLHHAKAASAELARRFNKQNLDIALIQEPWVRDRVIEGLQDVNVHYHRSRCDLDQGANRQRRARVQAAEIVNDVYGADMRDSFDFGDSVQTLLVLKKHLAEASPSLKMSIKSQKKSKLMDSPGAKDRR